MDEKEDVKKRPKKAKPVTKARRNKREMDLWTNLSKQEIEDRQKDVCGDLQVVIENENSAIECLQAQIKSHKASMEATMEKQATLAKEARDGKVLRSVLVEEIWDWKKQTITTIRLDTNKKVSERYMTIEERSTLPISV